MSSSIHWNLFPASELQAHAAVWDELNQADSSQPILDAEFWQICLSNFGTGDEVLALGHCNGESVAAGIFAGSHKLARNLFQPAQAPLGPWVLRPDRDIDPDQLIGSLKKSFGALCLLVGVTQQDPRYHPLPDGSKHLSTMPYIETAAIDTVGSFDDYWSARGKNLRQNMRKQRNRLQRENVATHLLEITAVDSIDKAIENYSSLEQSGWKASEGTAVTAEGKQGQFYKELFRHYARRGEVIAYQYYFNDDFVASDLCLLRDGCLIILKTAYDSSIKQLSPAFLLKEELFSSYFAGEKIQRVEFYGRLMEWHTRWTDDVRGLYHLNFATPLARVMSQIRSAKK